MLSSVGNICIAYKNADDDRSLVCCARCALGGLVAAHRHINHTRATAGCTYIYISRERTNSALSVLCVFAERERERAECSKQHKSIVLHIKTLRLSGQPFASISERAPIQHQHPPTLCAIVIMNGTSLMAWSIFFFTYTLCIYCMRARTFISANGLGKYLESFMPLVSPIYIFIVLSLFVL